MHLNIALLVNVLFAAVVVTLLAWTEDNYTEAWVLAVGPLVLGTNVASWYLTGNPFVGFITLVITPFVIVGTLGLVGVLTAGYFGLQEKLS